MAYDLEEQEQLDNLKAFWDKYGNTILTAVTVVALAVAAWRGWGWYQQRQAGAAAALYQELREAASAKDIERMKQAAGTIFGEHSGSVYAPLAALGAAKAYLQAGDAKAAKAPLRWAVDHASDPGLRQTARLRLAAILLDEKAYDEALSLLPANETGSFAALFADRRGDILLAQGKTDDARKAYESALKALPGEPSLQRLIRLKLDSIAGGA
ncbi:MAG: tetratricopeptide repeat protein [Burkholderiaceae bacterium]|nr:tetratricopeptide repeat protein [Burkholderiaceae bacterium]